MYRIVYSVFYLLSLLPWRVLYLLSDGVFALVYYVFGYRKAVVMNNLSIAFPEKTEAERKRIAKDFYHQLIDTFIETIKLISASKKTIAGRVSANIDELNRLYPSGQSVVIAAGHFFNWEFANLYAAAFSKFPFVGVYMTLSNKIFDRIMIRLRGKFGTILIPARDFRAEYPQYKNMQHAIGLVADQNPANPANGFWHPFFGKLAPFAKGPERNAKSMNAAIVLVNFYRVRRGYYQVEFRELTTTPREFAEGEITRQLIHYVEECVRKRPANYLWSHRRWKHKFDEEKFGHLVI